VSIRHLSIGEETIVTPAGESVLMPADIPHSLDANERFKMLLVMIRG
jgi:quercetin dioxygenase-like cupin family protein